MNRREPAWRILSGELNTTRVVLKSEEKMDPNYVLSPLGAMINRVYIVGKAIGSDDLGTDERSFYRVKVSDPTGICYLAVGEYQPAALVAMKNIEFPSYIAVIGKVKTFQPDNGGLYLSIRPESIYPTTVELRNRWLLSAVRSLKDRMEALCEAQEMESPTIKHLRALGYSSLISEGVIKSIEHYGRTQLDQYHVFLTDALSVLIDKHGSGVHEGNTMEPSSGQEKLIGSTRSVLASENLRVEKAKVSIENDIVEKNILDIITRAPSSKKFGINWNELLSEMKKRGIAKRFVEDVVRDLMERGIIYEPMIGVLKKI